MINLFRNVLDINYHEMQTSISIMSYYLPTTFAFLLKDTATGSMILRRKGYIAVVVQTYGWGECAVFVG